jgi:DNA-binding response OmpR family regulator
MTRGRIPDLLEGNIRVIGARESEDPLKNASPAIDDNAGVRILLVEDDARMRLLVRRGLAEQGHTVEAVDTGPKAVDAATTASFDAIVLDVMLPGFDGLEVLRRLRAAARRTPVIMLTARDTTADIVAGLDAGADDYLVKPFSFKVLLARLRALGRRATADVSTSLQIADLAVDTAAHTVTRAGAPIPLTRTEFNLLACLMRQSGRVIRRETLIDRVWGSEREIESNTLDAFVKSLRHKIEAGDAPKLLHTIRGVGYCLREEPEP